VDKKNQEKVIPFVLTVLYVFSQTEDLRCDYFGIHIIISRALGVAELDHDEGLVLTTPGVNLGNTRPNLVSIPVKMGMATWNPPT